MISSIISRLVILVFGTLYPAYASYKAVRTKNVKEYVKWMMYWIVFALFTCAETFTDVFCSFWFPFYYEFKVILVIWLLSPATKGSSILYRKFVHPMLTKREQEIDEYIAKAKEQGYHTVLTLGSKGVNYATTVIMQTAIKGGGGLVNQLRRSYSLSDISADMDALAEMNRIKALPEDEMDIADTPLPKDARLRRSRGYSPRRSASGSGRVEMYFPEVDVNVRQRGTRPRETGIPLSHIRSNEDVSSGYSSAEMLYSSHPPASEAQEPLVRTSSVGSSRVTRTKVARGGAIPKRPTAAEDNVSWSESEESDSGMQEEHFYDVAPASLPETTDHVPSATISQSVPPQSVPSYQTGSDFKSHLPVALEGRSKDKLVSPSEESILFSDVIQDLISNSVDGVLEEGTIEPSYYSDEEENGKSIVQESLSDKKSALEEGKFQDGELTTLTSTSELTVGVDNGCQPFNTEISSSTSEVSCLEIKAKTEDTKTLELTSMSKTTDSDGVLAETSFTPTICMPQEPEDIEFFDTEKDTTQNTIPGVLESHDLASLCEASTENQCSNDVATAFVDISKTSIIDLIPTTVHCDEMLSTENTSKNMAQDLEDNEFFDTETDLLQHPIPLLNVNNVVSVTSESSAPCLIDIRNEEMLTVNNQNEETIDNSVQKSGDDSSKEGRAGRYNKHPAPSPPLMASTEDLQLVVNKEEPESESKLRHNLAVSDFKSPSLTRGKSRSKSPQSTPGGNDACSFTDKNEHKSSEDLQQMEPSQKVNTCNPVTSDVDSYDVRPSEYYYNQYRAQASPKLAKKEAKSRQDTRFFSRILSKPRSTIASFLPFFSSRDEPQPLSDAMTTSLTSLDDMRAQDRMRSSSIAGSMPTSSEFISTPPEVPPRRRTPDQSGECGNKVNIREMSHSPTRR